jgi:hypothetical protein
MIPHHYQLSMTALVVLKLSNDKLDLILHHLAAPIYLPQHHSRDQQTVTSHPIHSMTPAFPLHPIISGTHLFPRTLNPLLSTFAVTPRAATSRSQCRFQAACRDTRLLTQGPQYLVDRERRLFRWRRREGERSRCRHLGR